MSLSFSPFMPQQTHSSVESLQLKIKSSFLDRGRQLIITDEYVEFDDNDLISAGPTKFLATDIVASRYGIKWIKGYQFVIGRIYCVDIKSNDDRIIKIRLKSLYGINGKKLNEKYVNIVNALYDHILDNISRNYLNQFAGSIEFEIMGVAFKSSGLVFVDKKKLIKWEDLGTKNYSTYYALFSKSDPAIHKTSEYLRDWNTGILYSVSRQILKDKGLYTE
jgi:hypothetical protein